jgi:glycogen debranching enzyme
MATPLEALDGLLSAAGWPHASAEPVQAGDPGRFHALFGRDSAIVSLEVLPARPDIGRATLRSLASLRGTAEDPETGEEPGKIVHEWWPRAPERLRRAGWPVRDGELRYYGSADSTSWFLVLLGSLGDRELASELERAWRAAGDWLRRALDKGGGLIRHWPSAGGGLVQQGWRDAEDPTDPAGHGAGILTPEGELPTPPLADAESQVVAAVALRALAVISRSERAYEEAAQLSGRIERELAVETLAIAGDGGPVPGAGSQIGWLLWGDVLSKRCRERAADRLCRPDLLTRWGLRTLSSEHPQYAADAYHRGAVWPFDSWLGWGGLRAAGRAEEAPLRAGVLEAMESLGGAPELYAAGADGPERIVAANRLQAWSVGARWALEQGWDGRATALF